MGVIYTTIICHVKNGEVMANGSVKLQGFYILGEAQELASILQSEQRMTNVQIPNCSVGGRRKRDGRECDSLKYPQGLNSCCTQRIPRPWRATQGMAEPDVPGEGGGSRAGASGRRLRRAPHSHQGLTSVHEPVKKWPPERSGGVHCHRES